MDPTEEEIVTKLKQLIEQVPDLGKKKLLSRLNSDNGWNVSSKDCRVYMGSIEDVRKRAADSARQQISQDEDPASSIGMLTGVMQGTSIAKGDRANSRANFKGSFCRNGPSEQRTRSMHPQNSPMMLGRLSLDTTRKARDVSFSMDEANTIMALRPARICS